MGDKFNKIIEGYKPIASRRMFYPRNMKLSEDFVNAFHREYDRLVGEGQNIKSLVERFGKAMKFHVREDRKYHKLDEEKARRAIEEERGFRGQSAGAGASSKIDPRTGQAIDCKEWIDGKEVPCKPNSRSKRTFKKR